MKKVRKTKVVILNYKTQSAFFQVILMIKMLRIQVQRCESVFYLKGNNIKNVQERETLDRNEVYFQKEWKINHPKCFTGPGLEINFFTW